MITYVATRESGRVEVRTARPGEDGKPLGDAFRDAKLLAGWHRESCLPPPTSQTLEPEPRCPMSGCGAGVLRPKCLFELSPDECPRHDLAADFRRRQREAAGS